MRYHPVSEVLPRKNWKHRETSQPIYNANQSTGFCILYASRNLIRDLEIFEYLNLLLQKSPPAN